VEDKIGQAEHILGVPENTTPIKEKDVFVLFGKSRDIENFIKINQ